MANQRKDIIYTKEDIEEEERQLIEETLKTKICQKCGNINDGDHKYCGNCGTEL